ncbi:uncharacterized protein BDZ99DRAFT_571765 [Mytilinidion resinicola]|uniref:Uncharacterized protein n=1 Tax=Mytilinidion resinicola TaxID=574789 RepID=A0A6A6YK33_9PEZI|nr:uncharacterized protein BDZ99DRAFT_571765 [Mytilinidion resinicola]KAF2808909.1 hypothetical protein BDZ99DRAFT_571765 [Mytilinidion resinicola]
MNAYDPVFSSRTSTGITWGMPVSIVTLGASLDRFAKLLPQLQTLRLCHRYGKGDDVHLTKLPNELLDMVINELCHVEALTTLPEWERELKCFEGNCTAMSHFEGHDGLDPNDLLLQYFEHEDPSLLPDDVKKMRLHEALLAYQWHPPTSVRESHPHYRRKMQWKRRLTQYDPSTWPVIQLGFSKYDQILKTHFGLEAFIAHRKVPDELRSTFPRAGWDSSCNTTVCYLTLTEGTIKQDADDDGFLAEEPVSSPSGWKKYSNSSFMTCYMDPDLLKLTNNQKLRFKHVQSVLGIGPQLHITRLTRNKSGEGGGQSDESALEAAKTKLNDAINRLKASRVHGARHAADAVLEEIENVLLPEVSALMEWPKLLNIAKTTFDLRVRRY